MPSNTRNQPSHPLSTSGGLRTNFRPEENAGNSWLTCKNMDTYDEFNSVGKIPGSVRVSSAHPGPVSSLHYFEYTSLEGVRTREALSLSAGNLYRINSDTSITQIGAGFTFASEPLVAITATNQIHLTSENQRGLPTGGVQWDGTNVRNWGTIAPGETPIVFLPIDAAADFTASADVAKSTDATVKRDAVASVRVDKTGVASAEAYIEKAGLGLNLSLGGDFLFVWLFVPAGSLQKLATSGSAVEIRYGGASLTNSHSALFGVGELSQGWNLLSWSRLAPAATTGTGATLSAIDTVRLRLIFASSAQVQSGFRWDSLYGTDDGSPTAALGAAGVVNVAVRYRVTFLDETGHESNAGPASNSVTAVSQQVNLTAIPVSSDPKIIARRVYRDKAGDAIYLFVDQIDNNVATTFTDNVPEAGLGNAQPPLAGDPDQDNSPPERFRDVVVFNNRTWGISADNPSILVPSNVNDEDSFPLIDQLAYEDELIALENHAAGLLVYASDKIYLQTGLGTVSDKAVVVEATNQSGTNGVRSVARIKGLNVTVREFEVFLVSDPFDPWQINFQILDLFRDFDVTALRDMHVLHDRSRFRLVFFGKFGSTYDKVLAYQYGTSGQYEITGLGPGVDPQDLRHGTWREISPPVSYDPRCSAMIERAADREELWIGSGDGYVYRLLADAADGTDWAVGMSSEPVAAEVTWSAVPLGASPSARGRPRFLRVNGTFAARTTWRVALRLMNAPEGKLVKDVEFDVTFEAGSSDPIVAVPQELVGVHAEYCQVQVRNSSAGGVGLFRDVELFYKPRGDFRGTRAA